MKKKVWMSMAGALMLTATTAFAQEKKAPATPMAATSGLNETLMQREHTMLAALQKKDFAAFKKFVMAGAWSVDENG